MHFFYTPGNVPGNSFATLPRHLPKSNGRTLYLHLPLIVLMLCISLLSPAASAKAQLVTIDVSGAPLREVLNLIKVQTGYKVWYEAKMLENSAPVTIKVTNAPMLSVLDKCMEKQAVTYEISNKTIVVKWRPVSVFDKAIKVFKSIRITGIIKDESQRPMSGVTVKVKGTSTTAISDQNGAFSIDAPQNAILQFTYIGYQTYEAQASENMEITLKPAVAQLEELSIVSTGFQTLPRERATGSFVKLNQELVERRVSTNILDRLEGVTSGLVMNKNFSAGNSNSSPFSIRGLSTIYGNAKPLIVVDNFPFDGDISNINPNDVESVTVLKDATAASIWGARSGNGVIVITTKRGRQGKPLSISFNSNVNLTSKPDIYYGQSFLDANGFIEAEQFLFSQGYYDFNLSSTTNRPVVSPVVEILAMQQAGTISDMEATSQLDALRGKDVREDLSRYFYRKAYSQQHSLNLSAGSDKYTYFVSAGYDKVPSVVLGDEYQRQSINSNFSFNPVKNLELSGAISYTLSRNKNNSIQGAIAPTGKTAYYPYADLVDDNGNALAVPKDYRQSYISSLGTAQLLDWEYRPFDEIRNNDNENKANHAKLNAGLKYTFIAGFSLDLKYQLEKQNNTRLNLQNQQSYYTRDLININTQINGSEIIRPVPVGAIMDNFRSELTGNSLRGQLTFSKNIGQNHEVNAIAGIDAKELIVDSFQSRVYGYDTNVATVQPIDFVTNFPKFNDLSFPGPILYGSAIDKATDEFFSYFANASYSFKRRYTISGSARVDQSNLFGVNTNQKGVPLWSAGAAWEVSKEHFYKSSVIPYLKVRATYGYNGNVDKSISAFTTGSYSSAAFISNAPYVTIQNPPNPELRWERIGMFNAAVDFSLNDGLLKGSIDYYRKNANDLLGYAPVDPTSGVREFKGNVGKMKANGLDLDLTISVGNRVHWESNFLYSFANNKVTEYRPIISTGRLLQGADGYIETQVIPVIGRPIFSVFSFPWAGLNGTDGTPQGYVEGEVTSDYNSLLNSTDLSLLTFNGPSRPTSFGSFRNSISYNGISLSVNVTYKLGYYFRKPALNYSELASSYTGYSDFNERWRSPGDEAKTNVPAFIYPFANNMETFYQFASINVEKGDHIRFQDVQVSYNLKRLMHLPFNAITVYGYVNNLGLIWKASKTGIDPDYIRDSYVSPRTYAVGVKATF